ncbi:hypothetical protein D1007_42315 [Hordeum vulgare]|nr:hypothetical protein D1007_42315 [Hordeum vulgare]
MAPAIKQKLETQGPAPIHPLMECAISKDVDLTPVLPCTTAESSEHGWTEIWRDATTRQPASMAVYPFFLHRVFAGLVPPFSSFFTAIMKHSGIHALHLQPNSILLLSVFAFYCEAFVGVRPSVALFHHFFSLRLHDSTRFVVMRLLLSGQGRQSSPKGWEEGGKLQALLGPHEPQRCQPSAECAEGAAKEDFCVQLNEALRPLGRAHPGALLPQHQHQEFHRDDKLRLRSEDLPTEELNTVVATLLGGDPGDLPEALVPLYRLDDRADLIAALLVFDERGLFTAEGSGLVEVSSHDTFGGQD